MTVDQSQKGGKHANNLHVGQMAEVLGVSIDTVWKWIRSGELQTYRIPGSGDRRLPRCQLEEFAAERGLPFQVADEPTIDVDAEVAKLCGHTI